MNLSLFGAGFVGGRYAQLYPNDTCVETRNELTSHRDDILWTIGTTTNYLAKEGDLTTDIESNLTHTLRVLPNVRGTFNLCSTWFVYGDSSGLDGGSHESDPCDPNGFYSITALAREKLLRCYCQTHNKTYRILRLCNVLGLDPRASKQKAALIHLLAKVKRGEDVEVYTGDQYRNWLHVDDVCRAIRLCLEEAPLNSVTNIGAPRSERTIDLIQWAINVTGSKSRITLVAPPRFHTIVQTPDFHMDTTKLRGLGFVPDMDAYQAVERVLAQLP